MGIDKVKFFKIIKVLPIIIWLIYLVIFNTEFRDHLPYTVNSNAIEKKHLRSDVCLALLGGSNVRSGLSARKISTKACKGVNLGLSGEYGGFTHYSNWLDSKLSADVVIYSPSIIWSDISVVTSENDFQNIIPAIPLISQVKAYFSYSKVSTHTFDSFGDQINYSCDTVFEGFSLNKQKFTNSNVSIVREIARRIDILKKITKAEEVLIRVPPIYVKKRNKESYMKIMNERIKNLNSAGIIVIGDTKVSIDKSLFCDSFHPNQKGRDVFSSEIKNALQGFQLIY